MSDFMQKLWSILVKQSNQQNGSGGSPFNLTSIFSYEIISNFYFEICCLYSNLFYNPQSLVKNCASQTKTLLDMIEQFTFTYAAHVNTDDSSQLIVVRLRFVNNILQNESLFDICTRNMSNFEHKIVCFIIFAYLNSGQNASRESNDTNSSAKNGANHVDRELQLLVRLSVEKLNVFTQLNVAFNSNLEEFLTSFIKKVSAKIKNTQVDFNKDKAQFFSARTKSKFTKIIYYELIFRMGLN